MYEHVSLYDWICLYHKSVKRCTRQKKVGDAGKRAFCIIANHSMMEQPEKLRMYLGGMGGTGKSQVIKALMFLFGERKESC
jgi:hypothetical protein